ncbi:uncharacterized protein LOC117324520 [Pecten maximus]|uniref:uncharacterized protein LOC117324520 n=1 Tax=Pecten maximus TaxID=6579 RepID=UPI001458BE25|nr:uncharacterized protein LOC117324520 [Pecten maximus]
MSKTQLYLLDIRIDGTCITRMQGKTFKGIIDDVQRVFPLDTGECRDGSPTFRTIHKFKVTGEPRVVTVVETSGGETLLERFISDLVSLGIGDITCTPLTDYEVFAQNVLDVDTDLCKPSPRKLSKKFTYWNELTIDYHGMTWEDFKQLWAKEASTVLGLRAESDANVDLYKNKNCRKVTVFTSVDDADDTDGMFNTLPLFVQNGQNVSNVCKAVQPLDEYLMDLMMEGHAYHTKHGCILYEVAEHYVSVYKCLALYSLPSLYHYISSTPVMAV